MVQSPGEICFTDTSTLVVTLFWRNDFLPPQYNILFYVEHKWFKFGYGNCDAALHLHLLSSAKYDTRANRMLKCDVPFATTLPNKAVLGGKPKCAGRFRTDSYSLILDAVKKNIYLE